MAERTQARRGRAQTRQVSIPSQTDPNLREALIVINQNFSLIDEKIEKIWEKIKTMEEQE